MKTILLLVLSVITIRGYSQDLPLKEGKVFYETVDSAAGAKTELYQKAKLWFANAFKDSKNVIQVDDKDNGQLVGKGNVFAPVKVMGMPNGNYCFFTMKIDVKDSKYRIQFYNLFMGTYDDNQPIENLLTKRGAVYKKSLESVDTNIKAAIADFKTAMAASSDANF